jgi:flagellar protein FlgJ
MHIDPLSLNNPEYAAASFKKSGFEEAFAQSCEKMDDLQLKSACIQFEAYFLQMMMKEMRKTSFSPKGREEGVFTEMFDEEVARSAANAQSFGLADELFNQLKIKEDSGPKKIDYTI